MNALPTRTRKRKASKPARTPNLSAFKAFLTYRDLEDTFGQRWAVLSKHEPAALISGAMREHAHFQLLIRFDAFLAKLLERK
jgi:hypothetical protein